MTAITGMPGVDRYVLQSALADLGDEAYTAAKKLSGTGIVSSNSTINTDTETYVGQLRWEQPIQANINVGSVTDPTAGALSSGGQEMLKYVKTTRAVGSQVKRLASALTQKDGLAKFMRDQTEIRTQDEHNAILAVLKGIAITEALIGAGNASGSAGLGGQTFDNDPESDRYGFYVDLGTNKMVGAASASSQGAARADSLVNALGMGYKDYEPSFAYLISNPSMLASLRSANLIDADRVQDGNLELETLFQGKFRLIKSRANQSLTPTEMGVINGGGGVDIAGTKISFLILPGSVAHKSLTLEAPVGIDENAGSYHGFGHKDLWYRWGYVAHPAGYSWAGSDEAFPADADYMKVRQGSTLVDLASATNPATLKGVWDRKTSSALSLGILPIFHG